MKSYRENLTAGQPLHLSIGGKTLFITRSEPGPVLTVEFIRRMAESRKIQYAGRGLKVTPVEGFEGIKITSPVGGEVDFVITDGDFDIAFDEDATIVGNGNANAIPVRTVPGNPLEVSFAGTVEPVLGVVKVENALSAMVHAAPVAVGLVATALISDATLKKLIFRNDHDSAKIALGGVGVTLENGAIVLLPGDIWKEEDAAGAAWYAISDTAGANVQIMGLK